MVNVLFVCMGNICRSPTAQGVFEELVRKEGLEGEISADSAGTGTWHLDHPPDERAQESARLRGIDLASQRARRISGEDFEAFDYILTMDEENYRRVTTLGSGQAEVRRFLDFHPDPALTEVPDPYFGESDGFERVFDLIEEASEGLLDDIRERRLSRRD